jgi:hypothetical protein
MPLRSPILDDRSYQQLRDEMIRRIPVYAPEWTDHNASDPGVTLIELFAYLGENLLYRFNQIPETAKLEFLRLLQIPLRAAVPARALAAMSTDDADGSLVPLRTEAKAGKLSFETETEVVAWPVDALAMARLAVHAPETGEEQDSDANIRDAIGGLDDDEVPAYYATKLVPAKPSAPEAVSVNLGETVDRMLWIAVLRKDTTDPNKLADAIINIGYLPDEELPGRPEPCPGVDARPPKLPLVWQISTRVTVDPADENKPPIYRELVPIGDTTGGLSRPGVVRLRLPKDPLAFGTFTVAPGADGVGDLPPAIEDDDKARKVLFWLRAYRPDGSDLGKAMWVGINAAETIQLRTARPEFLGTGTAQADQRVQLVNRQVMAGSLILEVQDANGWTPWSEVDGFHASGPEDKHYVLDGEAGEIRFGNGLQGFPPQIGQRIRATSYRYGGGRDGNVAAEAIDKLVGVAGVKVHNPLAARGGADGESVEDALARIPSELRRRDRAVAANDFRELALMTPGADVGRAEVIPLHHPNTPVVDANGHPAAAGVVSVVIWPREDRRRPDAPTPDRTMLATVCRWLDARRLVTTELYVIPPTYHKVAVSVGIEVKGGYGVEAVRRWVELVLRQYLAPLPPFGPSGQGWPLGRQVIAAELEAAALQVEGIEFLHGLNLAGKESTGRWLPADRVTLAHDEVPQLDTITIVAGPPLAAGEGVDPPPQRTVDGTTGENVKAVPIPVVREEC